MWLSLVCLCVGSHSVSHVGARQCDRERQPAADARAFKWASSGHGPLVTSSHCSILAEHRNCALALWPHVAYRHTTTRRGSSFSMCLGAPEMPQSSKTCVWGPAIAGYQLGEGCGSQVCESHELRTWLGRPEDGGGRWSLTMGQDFVFPRSFNMKLQTIKFKKGCQSRMLAWSLCWHVFVCWIAVSSFRNVAVLIWSRTVRVAQ